MITQYAKCGSTEVIPMIGLADQGEGSDGSLRTHAVGYTNPDAWVFKGRISARINATICGECGYTELTADDPAALYAAYRKGR